MKTITEFFGPSLAAALTKDKELAASGKTQEELPPAREQLFSELTRFEGEKLKHFMAALEAIASKPERVKRVVVWQVNEGEKAPKAALSREGFVYLVEYFPHAHGAAQPLKNQDEDRRDRKGRRGGRNARGRRDERSRGDGARGDSSRRDNPERREGAAVETAGADQRERRPRRPARPKGPGPVGIAAQGKPLPKPRSLSGGEGAAPATGEPSVQS
jgi:hypothetical protein